MTLANLRIQEGLTPVITGWQTSWELQNVRIDWEIKKNKNPEGRMANISTMLPRKLQICSYHELAWPGGIFYILKSFQYKTFALHGDEARQLERNLCRVHFKAVPLKCTL